MTVSEAMAAAQSLTGGPADEATLRRWLSELDGKLAVDFYKLKYWAPYRADDGALSLLVPYPWDGRVYIHHLEAMTYYTNGEYGRYENARVMTEDALDEFRKHVRRQVRIWPRPARMIREYYALGLWTLPMAAQAVHDRLLTEEEFQTITGEEYTMSLVRLPYLDSTVKLGFDVFGGYAHGPGAGQGTIWDMENMSGRLYPLITTRRPRYTVTGADCTMGLFAGTRGLYWVDEGMKLYRNGEQITTVPVLMFPVPKIHATAVLGDRIVILSRGYEYCYDEQTEDLTKLTAAVFSAACTIRNGTYAGIAAKANTIYSATVDWSEQFRAGDAVTISGAAAHPENNKTIIVREVDGHELRFYENSFVIATGGDSETLTVTRDMPRLSDVCACGNRVWGYAGSTVYASALGDPYNWYVFDGLSTDSWSVELEEPITGMAVYRSAPLFFTANGVYRVYGTVPENFEVSRIAGTGMLSGAGDGAAVVGDRLYYLASGGVIAEYAGGVPELLTEPFGELRFDRSGCVMGSDGHLLYLRVTDHNGGNHVFVFDVQTRLWHREAEPAGLITHFAAYNGHLYAGLLSGTVLLMDDRLGYSQVPFMDEDLTREDDYDGRVIFADFTLDSLKGKYPLRLGIRACAPAGEELTAKVSYDDAPDVTVATLTGTGGPAPGYFSFPIRRCDRFRLTLEGPAPWTLYALELEVGSWVEARTTEGGQNE